MSSEPKNSLSSQSSSFSKPKRDVASMLRYLNESDFPEVDETQLDGDDKLGDVNPEAHLIGYDLPPYMDAIMNMSSMNRVDIARKLMNSFDPIILKIQEKLRRNLQVKEEEKKDIFDPDSSLPKLTDDPEYMDEVNKILAECEPEVILEKMQEQLKLTDKEKKKLKRERQDSATSDQYLETNSMSAIWNMIDSKSNDNGFPITEFGYNVFKDSKHSWLVKEDKSWHEKEAIRKKCEAWMNKSTSQ